MKKLLILMLVLCFTSTSFGTTVGLSYTATVRDPGTTITIELIALTETVNNFHLRKVTDDAPTKGSVAGEGLYSGFNFGLLDGSTNRSGNAGVLYEASNADAVSGQYFTLLPGGPDAPAGTAIWSFDYTINASVLPGTTITLGITGKDSQLSEVELGTTGLVNPGGTSFVVTPEPMTIALLGLGGLFLRRRK